jgi:hypothetical protein
MRLRQVQYGTAQVTGGQPTDKIPDFGKDTPIGRAANRPNSRHSTFFSLRRSRAIQQARSSAQSEDVADLKFSSSIAIFGAGRSKQSCSKSLSAESSPAS